MRYVVVGDYMAITEFQVNNGLRWQDIIPVPQVGPVPQALRGLDPKETAIVLVYGSARWVDAEAMAYIESYRVQGAQLLIPD